MGPLILIFTTSLKDKTKTASNMAKSGSQEDP